jgi:hypothetical protein
LIGLLDATPALESHGIGTCSSSTMVRGYESCRAMEGFEYLELYVLPLLESGLIMSLVV